MTDPANHPTLDQIPGYPATHSVTTVALWDGKPINARFGVVVIADDTRFPQYWARPYVGQTASVWRLERDGDVFFVLDTDDLRKKIFHAGGYWNSGGHRSVTALADSWIESVQPEARPRMVNLPKPPKPPARRPGMGKSALKTPEMQTGMVTFDQLIAMREANPQINDEIEKALKLPGTVTVWTASAKASSIFFTVKTPKEGVEEDPDVDACVVWGGTEWQRKQAVFELMADAARECETLGWEFRRL